ncbi:hypothetical protein CsatB_024514 [Cannabis sativa]
MSIAFFQRRVFLVGLLTMLFAIEKPTFRSLVVPIGLNLFLWAVFKLYQVRQRLSLVI